jgi:phage tail sheath protein FI
MPAVFTQPNPAVQADSSDARAITSVPTSVTLFAGWVARGPVGRAHRITNFADYRRAFGGFDARGIMGHVLSHFYDNGGGDALVVRLVDADATTAGVTHDTLSVSAASPGQWANEFAVRTTRCASPDGDRFQLDVLDTGSDSAVVESYQNLSVDPSDSQGRFVETIVNASSAVITVTATGTSAPANATGALAGGDDGPPLLPGSSAFHAALAAAFEETATIGLDLANLVCVPGETDATTLALLQGWCRKHRAFLIIDTDRAASVQSLSEGTTVLPSGPDALNSAVFFPWVRAPDPLHGGELADFPPSGFVAGVFARTDAARGVWTAPAGKDASLNGAAGLAVAINDAESGLLNPKAINCLRTLPTYGTVVWGSRTLHGQDGGGPEWKYIPVRRMALFLEQTLSRGTRWAMLEPNDESLWSQIRLEIGKFLQGLFRQGAFQGSTSKEAYFVKCDGETTSQTDIDLGVINIIIGFAPLKPAEFVVIKLQQVAGRIPA